MDERERTIFNSQSLDLENPYRQDFTIPEGSVVGVKFEGEEDVFSYELTEDLELSWFAITPGNKVLARLIDDDIRGKLGEELIPERKEIPDVTIYLDIEKS